jgi:hypothetical protein
MDVPECKFIVVPFQRTEIPLPPVALFSSCSGWVISPSKWTMNLRAMARSEVASEVDWTREVWRPRFNYLFIRKHKSTYIICTIAQTQISLLEPKSEIQVHSHCTDNTSIPTVPRITDRASRRRVVLCINIMVARAKRSSGSITIVVRPSSNIDQRVAKNIRDPCFSRRG